MAEESMTSDEELKRKLDLAIQSLEQGNEAPEQNKAEQAAQPADGKEEPVTPTPAAPMAPPAPAQTNKRFEAQFAYDYLSPNDIYGSWETLLVTFFHEPIKELAYSIQAGGFHREEGSSALGAFGLYYRILPRFSGSTGISAATPVEYLPRYRLDQDFSFTFLKQKNLVWSATLTFIQYHNEHKDLTPSTGLVLYLPSWTLEYRFFANFSYPGAVFAPSHLLGITYGADQQHLTSLILRGGQQGYIATYVVDRPVVELWFVGATLIHRHWIGKDWGLFGDFHYERLFEGYHRYGPMLGGFVEF